MTRTRKMHTPAANSFTLWGRHGNHIPLTKPNSISQLLKAARKGHVSLPKADRLATARHRRGARGHETQGYAE